MNDIRYEKSQNHKSIWMIYVTQKVKIRVEKNGRWVEKELTSEFKDEKEC